MKFIKTQAGTSTDRTYTSSDGGAYGASTEQEFNNENLRLKKYVAVFKVRKGEQIGKKFGVKIKFKYRDNKSGKKKGRPKTPVTQYKIFGGNHAMTDTQAQELYNTLAGKTKNKWLKPVMQTEEWHETPDAVPARGWWSGYLGFEGYKSMIDPPVGYQMPGGNSDVFKILPYSRLDGEQNAANIQGVWLGFEQTTSIMELYPTYQDVLNSGFTAADESNGHLGNDSTRFYTTWFAGDRYTGHMSWIYLDSPYGPDWPSGWYNTRSMGDGAHYLNQTDGKLYRSVGGTTVELSKTPDSGRWELWEIPSVTRIQNYIENVVLPANVASDATTTGSYWHDFPRTEDGLSYFDDINKATQTRAYSSVEIIHGGNSTMNNWQNSKFTSPFTARSRKLWYLQPTTMMTNAGVDLYATQEPYPYETTFG